MPVDRPNRDRAANALAAYLRGEIDNFKFDDELTATEGTDDRPLRELRLWLWHYYDDIKRHDVHASPELWDFLIRTIIFLRTDVDTILRRPGADELDFASFPTRDEWHAHRHLLEVEGFPAYDPDLHARSPWGPILGAEINWPWFILTIAIIVLLCHLFAKSPR